MHILQLWSAKSAVRYYTCRIHYCISQLNNGTDILAQYLEPLLN